MTQLDKISQRRNLSDQVGSPIPTMPSTESNHVVHRIRRAP